MARAPSHMIIVMRWLVAAVLLASTGTLDAGTVYHVTFESSDTFGQMRAATVFVDGERIRVDYEALPNEPFAQDSVISTNGGRDWIALHSTNQTWFPLEEGPSLTPESRNFHGLSASAKIRKIDWAIHEEPAGEGEHHYSGDLSYVLIDEIEGQSVKMNCFARVDVVTTDTLDRALWVGVLPLRTRHPDVDAQIARQQPHIEGFPKRIELIATRRYEGGGRPFRGTASSTVDRVETRSLSPAMFQRPASYRKQMPVVGAPGG